MNNERNQQISTALAAFIKKSPTAFHAVQSIREILDEHGYERLYEEGAWHLNPGGRYYVIRNGSSIIAFSAGQQSDKYSVHITASHSDSPTFKVKENAVLQVRGRYAQLNTEGYGGMLCAPWFDRPLSLAGRVIVKNRQENIIGYETIYETRLLNIDRDLLMIPNVAIHMNRNVNDGMSYNKQIDMLPLIGGPDFTEEDFRQLIADELRVDKEDLLGSDLYLYNRMGASVWGAAGEYISAPRLDDLQCAYASLEGFLKGEQPENLNVYACFDNEEVGSGTKQGAASTFLSDTLSRVFRALGKGEEEYLRALANGFMLSCDNAHAVHPNHPQKTDDKNCVFMNQGIVIKSHAGQKYTSDAVSIAAFREICSRAGVPVQYFANRSDAAGGSTLGNIAMTQVSCNCVDIGLAQLAMHSPYETAGMCDTAYMIDAVSAFYHSHFQTDGDCFRI